LIIFLGFSRDDSNPQILAEKAEQRRIIYKSYAENSTKGWQFLEEAV
jgi:hypothetical protein